MRGGRGRMCALRASGRTGLMPERRGRGTDRRRLRRDEMNLSEVAAGAHLGKPASLARGLQGGSTVLGPEMRLQ